MARNAGFVRLLLHIAHIVRSSGNLIADDLFYSRYININNNMQISYHMLMIIIMMIRDDNDEMIVKKLNNENRSELRKGRVSRINK